MTPVTDARGTFGARCYLLFDFGRDYEALLGWLGRLIGGLSGHVGSRSYRDSGARYGLAAPDQFIGDVVKLAVAGLADPGQHQERPFPADLVSPAPQRLQVPVGRPRAKKGA